MAQKERIRVLMAKPGIDGHWRGIITVTKALRDAGIEAIYIGNQSPEQIAHVAIQEDVDVVGLSVLSAGHMRLIRDTIKALKEHRVENVLVVVGGIIPQVDIPAVKANGVGEVFGPGTPLDAIVNYIKDNAPHKISTT